MYPAKLENMQKLLNEMVGSEKVSYEEILKVSQELDKLIVKVMKQERACVKMK